MRAEAKAGSSAGQAVHALVTRLQDERRLTAALQDNRTKKAKKALEAARSRTDSAVKALRASAAKLDETVNADKEQALTKALDDLTQQRNQVDLRAANRSGSYRFYTEATDAGTTLLTDVLHHDDGQLAHSAAAVTSLAHITELLSREDALVTGAGTSGYLTSSVRQTFLGHVAAQRHVARTMTTRDIPASAAEDYRRIADKPQWAVLQRIEDTIGTDTTRNTATPPGTATRWAMPDRADEWRPAADAVNKDLREATSASLDGLAEQGTDRADEALLTAVGGSAAVLAVLVLSAVLAVRSSRSLTRRLAQLHETTAQWTEKALPELVESYKEGERADSAPELPSVPVGHPDEVGRLIAAVREQQRTAVTELHGLAESIDARWKTAARDTAQRARKREGAETVVLGLLRRNQLLISQLISLIDGLERREHDPELLTDIFKIDHLVTRLRRDLENQSLIVGVQPGRRWSKPVPVFQVLRSAVAETIDYTRVDVETAPEFSLSGRVVADVGHILAALIENGTSFSPPHTHVNVRAEEVAGGRLAVEVVDRGLGMDAEQYEHLNQLLADPPEPDVTRLGEIPQLGLFVVALLANRIGLEITLCKSAYGGTKAVVLIPNELLEEAPPVLPGITAEPVRERLAEHYGGSSDTHITTPEPEDEATPEPAEVAAPEPAEVPTPEPEPEPEPAEVPAPELTPRRTPRRTPRPATKPAAAPAPAAAPVPAAAGAPKYTGVPALDPEDHLGGYPAYTGGGLLTRPRTLTATEALAATALAPPATDVPEVAKVPTDASAPGNDEVSRNSPESAQKPLTLPTRRPGENLAAPLRRPPEQAPHTQQGPPEDGDHAPLWPAPDRAGTIAGAVQRASRQARTESSDAQCNGVSPEDA